MIEKVIKVYKALNSKLIKAAVINNQETRNRVAVNLENKLQNCDIICDETNNMPMLIDGCMCIARVQWINKGMEISYVDLIFGTPEQVQVTNDKMNLL